MSSSGRLYAWTNERQNPSQAKLDGFLFSLDREGLFLTWFASALPCSLSFKRINTKSGTRTVGNAKGALQCQNLGGSLSMKALNVGFSLTYIGISLLLTNLSPRPLTTLSIVALFVTLSSFKFKNIWFDNLLCHCCAVLGRVPTPIWSRLWCKVLL